MASSDSVSRSDFHIRSALGKIIDDAVVRFAETTTRTSRQISVALVAFLPVVRSAVIIRERDDNSNASVYSNDTTKAYNDTSNVYYPFQFFPWRDRAAQIRENATGVQCLVALSQVMDQFAGPLTMAEANGTSGVLSLLPTAGALIGSPAKESWLVYKLMPFAGVLSMLLSLGGNIVPTQASEYLISSDAFYYGGLIATTRPRAKVHEEESLPISGNEVQKFTERVKRRASKETGTSGLRNMTIAIAVQIFWLAVLLMACWFTGIGTIIPWWCNGTYWMLFWYLCVALSSIFENITSVPFTRQWTIRISRAPASIQISSDAPRVAWTAYGQDDERKSPGSGVPEVITCSSRATSDFIDLTPQIKPTVFSHTTETLIDESSIPLNGDHKNEAILDRLKSGFNTQGRVILDRSRPYSGSRTPFYVIVSLEGMSSVHVVLRIVSKFVSIIVFTLGTFMFATTTLVTITVGVVVMALVLSAGIFGRVVTMWMASELMRHEPVLHKTVKREDEAAEYVNEVLAIPGLVCEVNGHVVVNGRCVARYKRWFTKAHYFGVLAKPYDVTKLSLT